MKLILKAGATSQVTRVFLQDATSTTGAGLIGLAFGSSGLKWSYIRDDQATVTVVTPATATVGTWATAGFKEVDATNFPGLYEIGIPNAALTSGKGVQMMIFGATNLVPCPIEIELTAVDLQNATTLGLTNLDAAITSRMASYTQPTGFLAATFPTTVASTTNITGGTITTATNLTNLPAVPTDWLTAAGVKADAVTKIQSGLATPTNITAATGVVLAGVTHTGATIPAVTTVGTLTTYTGNTPQTGDSYFRLGPPTNSTIAADIATRLAASSYVVPPTTSSIAAAVIDLPTSGHTTSGSVGAAIVAAGSAGDPWATPIPGSYGDGTAGKLLGDGLVATSTEADGTAQGGTSTTITLAADAPGGTDTVKGRTVTIMDGTGVGQSRVITAYNGTTKAATVAPPWAVTPDATSTYFLGATVDANVVSVAGNAVASSGAADVNVVSVGTGVVTAIQSGLATATNLGAVKTDTAAILGQTGTTGVVVAGGSKAGYSLANGSITSSTFNVSAPSGVATGILEKIDQLWRRFFKKATRTTTQIQTFADNGSTVVTSQAISDDGAGNETQGAAS